MSTTAPSAFIVSMIFSASSLGTDSFITLGALSTNFLESTRLRPSSCLISLMTLGLAAASNSFSFRVKSVFSAAAGAASSASSTGAAAPGAPAAAAAAKPPTGRSGMLRRDWSGGHVS
jgi:midasin